ncbi:MAG: hypothetical protein KGI71_04305 [Patescibacteria group bacterium]|nr:hypothetical protein [Patescibacteria group bacterium]
MSDITSHLKQLSDGNGDGTVLGQNSSDVIAFYGATPVAQRAGGNQTAISQAAANGVLINIFTPAPGTIPGTSTVSTAAVTITCTGAGILSSDHIVVNKITNTQAGLGIAGVRAGVTADMFVANFVNLSATATLTPLANETYLVAALRGIASTVALTPAMVASNAAVEQVFTVTGLAPNQLVSVIKPTDQPGLGIAGFRVVQNNQLGITFLNDTAAGITPTAAESYSYVNLNGLTPISNVLDYGCNISAAFNSTVSQQAIQQTLTVSGILSTDTPMGPPARATSQSSAIPIMSLITAANAIGVTILNGATTAGITPTANEIWHQAVYRRAPIAPLTVYSVSLSPTAVGPNTTSSQGFTVTGLVALTPVLVNNTQPTSNVGIVGYRVSAANVLEITFANPTSATITPPTATYLVGNFGNPVQSGNNVTMMVSPVMQATVNLTNEIRATLAGNGMIAGA